MPIELKIKPTDVQLYHITAASKIQLGTYVVEMIEKLEVEFQYLLNKEKNVVAKLKIKSREVISSHEEFFRFSTSINALLDNVLVLPNESGQVEDIVIHNLKQKRSDLENKLKTTLPDKTVLITTLDEIDRFLNDKQRVKEQLNIGGYQYLFFGGFYKQYDTDYEEERIYKQLIMGQDLPIQKHWKLDDIDNNKCYMLQSVGKINKEKFDHKTYTRSLKELVGVYNLKTDYIFDYEEQFLYDQHHILQQAETYMSFIEHPIYEFTMVYQLNNITEGNNFAYSLHKN